MSQTKAQLIDNLVQPITGATGSASAPTFSFTSDPNTGLYSPGADQLALTTNSSERIRIGTNGEIGLAGANYGTNGQVLTSAGSGAAPTWTTPSAGNTDKIEEGNTSAEVIDTGSDGRFVVTTEGSERLRVDSSGRLGVGTASPGATLDVSETSSGATVTSLYLRNPAALAAGTVSRLAMTAVNTGSRFAYIDAGVTGASDNGHYLAFGTNPAGGAPTEKMRLTTDGRLGIGTTSPSKTLHVALTASNSYVDLLKLTNSGVGSATQAGLVLSTGDGISTGAGDIARIKALDVGGYKSALTFETSQRSAWGETTTEACRIDSSGRLLVGTSTSANAPANCKLVASFDEDVRFEQSSGYGLNLVRQTVPLSGAGIARLRFIGYSTGTTEVVGAQIQAEADGQNWLSGDCPSRLVFSTTADGAASPTERMRITNSGKINCGEYTNTGYFDGTLNAYSPGPHHALSAKNGGSWDAACQVTWHTATNGNNSFALFATETSPTVRGSIDYNRTGGAVRYNTTSDARLKSSIQNADSALAVVSNIKVRSYEWKETGYKVSYGFVAQELNQTVPDAVKTGDSGDEVTDAWAVDYSKVVPVLTKALQEALAKIETLEAKVATLEAQ